MGIAVKKVEQEETFTKKINTAVKEVNDIKDEKIQAKEKTILSCRALKLIRQGWKVYRSGKRFFHF